MPSVINATSMLNYAGDFQYWGKLVGPLREAPDDDLFRQAIAISASSDSAERV